MNDGYSHFRANQQIGISLHCGNKIAGWLPYQLNMGYCHGTDRLHLIYFGFMKNQHSSSVVSKAGISDGLPSVNILRQRIYCIYGNRRSLISIFFIIFTGHRKFTAGNKNIEFHRQYDPDY